MAAFIASLWNALNGRDCQNCQDFNSCLKNITKTRGKSIFAMLPRVVDSWSWTCKWSVFFDPFQETHFSLPLWGSAINNSETHAHRMLSKQHLPECGRWGWDNILAHSPYYGVISFIPYIFISTCCVLDNGDRRDNGGQDTVLTQRNSCSIFISNQCLASEKCGLWLSAHTVQSVRPGFKDSTY